jgi:hypothetical protein
MDGEIIKKGKRINEKRKRGKIKIISINLL